MTGDELLLFRSRGDGTLAASVRTIDGGVFDIERRSFRWRCSCGRLGCAHLRQVHLALASVVEAAMQ